jgi:hypothetical protein
MKPIPGLGNYQGQRLVKIDKKTTAVSSQYVFDIPQDRVYKEFIFIHEYNLAPTYASTTPVMNPRGASQGMITNLELARSGNDVVKVFRGIAQLQDQAQWIFGEPAPIIYKVNSTTVAAAALTGVPTFGTSTQVTAAREVFSITCENKQSSEWVRTCFNTNGINTAKIRLQLGAASLAQDPDDAAVASAWAYSGSITVYGVTADHLGDVQFDDFRQYYDEILFSAQSNRSVVELRPLGMLQGMHLRAYAGTGNGGYKTLTPEELRNFEIEIKFNDSVLFEGNMADFQAVNGAKSSMRAFMKSSAYLNLLNNSTYGTGLETGQDAKAVTPLRLTVTTPSSINHSTNPVRLVAEYDVIANKKA